MNTCIFPFRGRPTGEHPENGASGGDRDGSVIEVPLPDNRALLHFGKTHRLTAEQLIHAAWALVLRRYVGSDTVVFGVWSPATANLATYFTCVMEEPSPFLNYIKSIKNSYHSSSEGFFQGTPPLVVNTHVNYYGVDAGDYGSPGISAIDMANQSKFAFVVDAHFSSDLSTLNLVYNDQVDARIAQNVSSTLAKALATITSLDANSSISVNEMDLLSDRDKGQLRAWDWHYPTALDYCVHEMISIQAQATPHAEAICSWDGKLTYGELEDLSNRLAAYLQREYPLSTGPEKAIGVCFEKSFVAVVCELAILKTGSAFVPLDGAHPMDRLKTIVDIAEISLILTSPKWIACLEGLVDTVVRTPMSANELWDMFSPEEPNFHETQTSILTPRNAAFILFTSGSTGTPKAIVQPHGVICTLFKSHAKGLHVDASSRVLQFAAYTFDVSTMDIFTTLMQGGCLCIPSEDDRRTNLAGFIRETQVNWADLTATVANLLHPHQVPTLRTLVLAGEAVQEEHLERWFGHVRLINCYGPVESGNCTAYEFRDRHSKPAETIGRAMDGARCWIVSPQNPDRLASVGELGEILVEGPTLSRGYLKDTLRTQAAFIQDPRWATDYFSYPDYSGPRRFYRTADMAYIDPDGLIVFVGRADQQVKVHGQRVELMEIEHHLTTNFQSTVSRAVVAYPRSGPLAQRLVGVLQLENSWANDPTIKNRAFGQFGILDDPRADLILRSRLPTYMVPVIFLVIGRIPLTSSGKSDRKLIHDLLCSLPGDATWPLLGISDSPAPLASHETVAAAISNFLAELLRLDVVRNRDVSLDRLGISSIQAMTLLTWLKAQFHANVSIEYLSKGGVSIRSLAKAVELAASAGSLLAVDLEKEVKQITDSLSLELKRAPRLAAVGKPRSPISTRNVFLTGATGYLGIEIFRQLLSEPTVSFIYVLVQARDPVNGLARLRQALIATGHEWDSEWDSRVTVWPGDLSKPRLGLEKQQWEYLTRINTFIHNGALVRYNLCYEKLKSVNVLSTVEILRAMYESPYQITFVYVSGGQRLSPEEESSEAARIRQASQSTGYSQSKLVSELVVSRMAKEFAVYRGHRLRVVRPGYIIGSPTRGVANTRDYIWRVVAGAVELGIKKHSRTNEWMFVCDVEQVAQKILRSGNIIPPEAGDTPADVTTVMDGVYLADIWALVSQELQCTLRPLHSSQWWSRLRHFVEQQGDCHPLWPLYFLLNQEQGAFTCCWKSNTPTMNTQLVMQAFRRNVDYLAQTAFLSRPRGDTSDQSRCLLKTGPSVTTATCCLTVNPKQSQTGLF